MDAGEAHLEAWYVARLLKLRETAFQDPSSYFHSYAALPEAEVLAFAQRIWADINARNLHENIAPTRERAQLILEKGADHSVERVHLRRL